MRLMSESCICPLAGWCDRHKINKGETWHLLCQTNQKYFDAWEQGYGPGQQGKPLSGRAKRVVENVKRNKRLRGWVMSMRTAGEVGIGDTLVRLIKLAGRRAILRDLKCMHRACSCNKIEATEKLNRDYPY